MTAPNCGEYNQLIADLARDGYDEVKFVEHHSYPRKADLYDTAHDDFIQEHGARAVPVTTQAEVQRAVANDKKCKPVIVSAATAHLVRASVNFSKKVVKPAKDKMAKAKTMMPSVHISKLYTRMRAVPMSDVDRKILNSILDMSKEWRWK
jgi:hypothetical protein